MKSPIKYVGSKGRLVPEINNYIPNDTSIILEPFCGSAALSFHKELPFYISDLSPELVHFLKTLSEPGNVERMIDVLLELEQSHSKDFYIQVRSVDRAWDMDQLPDIYRACRYYYIIYAGFNGLYRVNKKNQCNTPWGDRVFRADVHRLRQAGNYLQRYCRGIFHQEFDDMSTLESVLDSGIKPFVFIDPPYYGDKVFKSYTPEGDGGDFYYRLDKYLTDLDSAGVTFLMTNSYDDYILDMFEHKYTIDKVATKYSVSADGNKRGEKFEAFVTNADICKLIEQGSWGG